MQIRQATVWDAVKITEMWRQSMTEIAHMKGTERDPESFYLHIMVAIKHPDHRVLVAEEDGELIGFVTGFITREEFSNSVVGLCDNAFVVPDRRGKKVYFDLMNRLQMEGIILGASKFKFQFRYDPAKVKVWERLGFKPSYLVYEKEA